MNNTPPPLDFIAAQLRKPSGSFAATIAQNMDKTNEPLFDLTLQSINVEGDQKLLEIGFGSGRFIHKLFSHWPTLEVTGVDYASEMVNMAASINDDLLKSGRLKLEEGSSDQLPFEDETFDVVFCNMVIYFWDNPEKHLGEVWRVLKPGGKFYTGFRTKQSMLQMPFVKYGFALYELDEWQAILEKNGFEVASTNSKVDPEMETNGRKIQLESVCVVAQKHPISRAE